MSFLQDDPSVTQVHLAEGASVDAVHVGARDEGALGFGGLFAFKNGCCEVVCLQNACEKYKKSPLALNITYELHLYVLSWGSNESDTSNIKTKIIYRT